jgi:YNFM family putative membrane transporter
MLSTSSPPPTPGRSPTRAIVFLAVAGFASQAMVRSVDTLLPQIATDVGTTVGTASIVVTAYALTHATVQLFIGPIADRVGKYLTVTTACFACAVTVALCGLAQSLSELTMARLLSGASAAWILPLAMAYVGDVVPYERRQQVLGRFLTGQISGQLFGQAASGVLGDFFGWRAMFFVLAAVFAVAALALAYELVTNPITRKPRRAAQPGEGLFADYRTVLSSPWVRFVLLVTFIEGGLVFGVFTFIGADLHLRFGMSYTAIGLIVATFGIGGIVYVLFVRVLVDRLGQTGIALGGGFTMAAAFLTLAVQPTWLFAPVAVTAMGFGFYMMHNTLQTIGTQMCPEARGTAVALFASVYYLGQMTAVALSGPVVDLFGAPPLFAFSALMLPLLAWWFTRRLKRR